MEDVIDANIIKATQVSLGKYVKRPPLNDKLLRKPPFRFLHDIITSVLKTTGFFSGLFEDDELISDKVKDRESKILFLTKVISVIGTTTGKSLSVKPSKIVAGQEPGKTNELLQSLAFALDNKLSSDEAVRLYKETVNSTLSSEKRVKDPPKPVKKSVDIKKTSKSTEKLVKIDKNPIKTKQKENSTIRKESPPKKVSQATKIINKKGQDKDKQEIKSDTTSLNKINHSNVVELVDSTDSKSDINNLEISQENDSSSLLNANNETSNEVNDDSRILVEENASIPQDKVSDGSLNDEKANAENNEIIKIEVKNERVSSKHENEIFSDDFNKNYSPDSNTTFKNENTYKQDNLITSQVEAEVNASESKAVDISHGKRPNSVRRPSSSRPGAPRFRDKHEMILSAVDNLVVGKVNIIVENTTHEEEEESSIVIVENTDTLTHQQDQDDQLQISSNQHGHLVQQILNAQKEFSEVNGKTNIEWQFEAQKARDVVNQEIEQLRFNVQALSRVANPLGKLLDHIQEDVEIMRQELQQWTKSYEEASKQLLKQKIANEESLLPLHSKIKQLEADISEKYDKINDLKIVIHKNTLRIEKLLPSGNVQ